MINVKSVKIVFFKVFKILLSNIYESYFIGFFLYLSLLKQ
jgi:hypothetical protein